ncbi:glycosyltransferase family 61 protein [Stappia stellulata]|uniref:glycosyltransferase family 61 protein n=1 Tax=Stappia stellulata TaxID=71235 RepID=UPI001CD747B6|nr:glycosyltransferase family 61 protein [Stappia stellulata]MCA1242340.1 glycosyltransferase family 61 protein [Stappia stellulata]
MLVSSIDLFDRALSLDARRRPGFSPAPTRLQGCMPMPEMREEARLGVPPLVWRREAMSGASLAPAGVLVEPGLRVACLPYASANGDHHARTRRLSSAGLRSLRETHPDPALRAALRRRLDPRMRIVRLDGDTVLLGAHFTDCENYFHFWVDAMCDLWFLKQCGLDWSAVRHVLMPWSGTGWQREIAALCGISPERVVPLSSADGFVLERGHVPLRIKGGTRNHDWIVRAMREISGWRAPEAAQPGRRIYVTRAAAVRRPLRNEAAVRDVLAPFGFEIVDCAGLSVAEQRAVFASAQIVVAPHGAGLTNVVWARPGTGLIEFMPRAHANPCFVDMAAQAGLAYGVVPSIVEDDGVDPIFAGYAVDPGHVAAQVRAMLDG